MKTRTLAKNLPNLIDQSVTVAGWVNSRRDHGGLIFIDLRDTSGLIQLVITPEDDKIFRLAESLRDEFVILARGIVRARAKDLVNPNHSTGAIELAVEQLEILNKSATPVVNVHDEGAASGEDLRLKYRYLDLRRPRMQQILKQRAKYNGQIRRYMEEHDFTEVTTPILANSSPEGARDFLIPSRVHPGKFYALPQAPQQFKQLLMVGGLHRYYQIAPCFRDEDPRADRLYGDFYQLDLEMSFVDDGEVVRTTMEPLIKGLVTDFAGKQLKFKEIPRIPYLTSMEKYGTDKPDLRYDMPLIDLTEVLENTEFKVFQTPCVKALCVKGGSVFSRSQIDNFTDQAKKLGAGGLAYLIYESGEVKSPIAKFLSAEELEKIKQATGATDGDAVFFAAAERPLVNKILGQLRIIFADQLGLADPNTVALCWVVDFPFYEWDERNDKLDFGHNPFSMPRGGIKSLTDAENKLDILADQYDMVMNGYEICSGAVRNHNPDIMYQAFANLGFDKKYVEERFGGMLSAFKFGAPPHAGCAFGLDRIFMVLMDIPNVRDCVAFPKNGSGVDLMMNSPNFVDQSQLDELYLSLQTEDSGKE